MQTFSFRGWQIPIEHPVEIAIRKLYHRADGLKPRDIFDIAVIAKNYKDEIINQLHTLTKRRESLIRRINSIPPAYYNQSLDELDIFPEWTYMKDTAKECFRDLIERIPTNP